MSNRYPFLDDVELAIARAVDRAGVTLQPEIDYLRELIEASAGQVTDEGQQRIAYRPYYAAAALLEQRLSDQRLDEADGVSFTGYSKPINSLRCQQRVMDMAHGVSLHPAYRAVCLGPNAAGKMVDVDLIEPSTGSTVPMTGPAVASSLYPTTTTYRKTRYF